MKILAFEFSSPQRSVALVESAADGSSHLLAEASEAAGQNVAPLALVEQVLSRAQIKRAQVECLAVGLGPGSYTGIRGAIALAQGWQLAGDVKLLGISSVESIAAAAQTEGFRGRAAVVVDAQRGELYVAEHEIAGKALAELSSLRLITLSEFFNAVDSSAVIIGPEVNKWFPAGQVVFPTAAAVGCLAAQRENFISGEKMEPIYLRATTFVKAAPPRVLGTL
ncbi:MAG TPA: tRNA (adenosine(37)-N6)-threonylcarbamoyltransferase complex dimerization subunit type 1 TsaB [Dongiaceae bacterium]|jgi:tRNA threonylcarbamoyl adenosine modification protein YeaZ|nr:tRNA (adenosine(37)-N6)-threonylcarbamoyltransferase complex dimerization subunit type 1 TsaB [Dongiaceae bacterium]